MNDALRRADTRNFIEQYINIFLMTENGTQRPGNLIGRKQPRCYLVQHRAKEIVIPFVDQRDANRGAAQRTSRGESSEATTDDNDMWHHNWNSLTRDCLIG